MLLLNSLPATVSSAASPTATDSPALLDDAYLAEKHANGQLSTEDYAVLQQVPVSHKEYLARFRYQPRQAILNAYLHNQFTIKEVMYLLRLARL